MKKTHKKSPVLSKYKSHLRLYKVIEGAIVDAYNQHPEYFTEQGKEAAVQSITKRVTGLVLANSHLVHTGGNPVKDSPDVSQKDSSK